mgnify:CR=1 FL=1
MQKLENARRCEAGFSLIEGLIAAALLLIVTVGVLPLFSRAMLNNVKGNDSTRQANGATDEFERSLALPFNSGAMEVPGGSTQVVETRAIALKALGSPPEGPSQSVSARWELVADLGTDDLPMMTRQRTLRQFSFDDFNDNQIFDSALDGDVEDRLVHLKVVDVTLDDPAAPLARPFQLRIVQAF